MHAVLAASNEPNVTRALLTVGSLATFSCTCTLESSQSRLFWSFAAVDPVGHLFTGTRLVCGRPSLLEPWCSITFSHNNRTSLLTLNHVWLTYAGLYTCNACWPQQSSTEVTVIGKKLEFVHVLSIPFMLNKEGQFECIRRCQINACSLLY